jgi:hypothetical protein
VRDIPAKVAKARVTPILPGDRSTTVGISLFPGPMHPARFLLISAFTAVMALPGVASAQAAPAAKLGADEIKALAATHVAMVTVHDSIDAELAQARNKKESAQTELQEKMRKQIAAILAKSQLSDAEFEHRRFLVSSDSSSRRIFDAAVSQLTGVAAPGQAPAAAAAGPQVAVPAGIVGTHIGHVVNSFPDTPDKAGLLPTAMAEAKIAQQHAALAAKNTGSLDAMKLHAGHVINALDPTVVPMGPGKGYGVKKAATNIAAHIEMAGKGEGATAAQTMHAGHVAAAARSTVTRADAIIAIAKQIQASTDAKAAAGLVGQMASLCDQLVTGADSNADGKVNFDAPEGGLVQVQEHVNLMLGTAKP